MAKSRRAWLDETVEQIKFKPDRNKVRDELLAHIEDRCEVMQANGYSEEEAEIRAVAAMGDPEEVGKQLNAVHKPWLGWLWMVSRVLVILVLLAFIRASFLWNPDYGYVFEYSDSLAGSLLRGAEPPEGYELPYYDEPGVSAPLGDFTVTVDKVTLNRYEGMYDSIAGLVTVDGFLPWERPMETRNFYVVDDKGNYYVPRYTEGSYFVRKQHDRWELSMSSLVRTATGWTYWLRFEPLDEMEWFELRCDVEDRNFVLRVDMTGGETP